MFDDSRQKASEPGRNSRQFLEVDKIISDCLLTEHKQPQAVIYLSK